MNNNNIIQPLLTDFYQITMAYAYWKAGKYNDRAVFELFFRKNPFGGQFTIFAGLEECLLYLKNFCFSPEDVDYLKSIMPSYIENSFYDYLLNLNTKELIVYALKDGTVCFPKEPLICIEGPLIISQLIETTLLSLINYSSLVATNAARYRIASGNIQLIELGLRRAQGPDGAFTGSKYSYLGGFDATSNVLSGKLLKIPIKGTHAHSFIMSFCNLDQLITKDILDLKSGNKVDLVKICKKFQVEICKKFDICLSEVNQGEFISFISYAISFPSKFFALIDTYNVLKSGLINFCAVALGLHSLGYKALGVRIDSGDLAYLSREIYKFFSKIDNYYNVSFKNLDIMASNDINEDIIYSLNEQGHNITIFGIGTKLITCEKQPSLGCVYKLVEIDKMPCIKLSESKTKITIPFKKKLYRLYSKPGDAILDLMTLNEENLLTNNRILCRHPFLEYKRAYVIPEKIESLLELKMSNGIIHTIFDLNKSRQYCIESLKHIRKDVIRRINPTPYKVSVSSELYSLLHENLLKNTPIGNLF